MSDHYLMSRGGVEMFVPPSKLAKFKDEGWVVVREPDPKPEVKKVSSPPPAPKAQAEAEEEAVSVDEAVEKLGKGKRARSKKA